MSLTLWVLRQSKVESDEADDDFDHSLFYQFAEALDHRAEALQVTPLSAFFDFTDMQFNLTDDDPLESASRESPQWFAPAAVLPSLRAIIDSVKSGAVEGIPETLRQNLIDELTDSLLKVEAAEQAGDCFHFCIVM